MQKGKSGESLENFRPQRRNANKHTQRGLRALEASLQSDGWIDAQTAAADGEIISGSARLEVAADKFAGIEPIVVESDGTRPVIVKRVDIPNAQDERAIRLAVAANRIAQIDLDFDPETLKGIIDDGIDLSGLFDELEIASLIGVPPSSSTWASAMDSLPNEDRAPFQQMTFTLHDTQAERVKDALALAKACEGYDAESENENSNGNALAYIIDVFLSLPDYGNG